MENASPKSRRWRSIVIAVLIGLFIWLLTCSSPLWLRWYDVWKHERDWKDQQVDDYRIMILAQGDGRFEDISGLDINGELIICDGHIKYLARAGALVPCRAVLDKCLHDPIEALFRSAQHANPLLSDVDYDPNYHYPREISFERGSIVVKNFQPIACH